MRDRAGMVDLSAFAIFDIAGPGALAAVQGVSVRQMDVAVGRVVYTPILSPGGGFKADLTIMRLGEELFRVVTGGAHGAADKKWFTDHLPADGSAQLSDVTTGWTTLGLWGPRARDILGVGHVRRRVARGLPVRVVPRHRDRLAARARVADLVRRRPGLGALRPHGAGRAAVGHPVGGRPAARRGARRHRRLRHHRPAREVLPGLRRSSSRPSTTWSRRACRGRR